MWVPSEQSFPSRMVLTCRIDTRIDSYDGTGVWRCPAERKLWMLKPLNRARRAALRVRNVDHTLSHLFATKDCGHVGHSNPMLAMELYEDASLCFASLCFALLCFNLLCFALLQFALLCFASLCFALLRFASLCFALLHFALLCFTLLCFALLHFASTIEQEERWVQGGGTPCWTSTVRSC